MASTQSVIVKNIAAYTPAETIELITRIGAAKGNMRPDKIFTSAVSAGCLLSFAAASTLICNASPWLADNSPGLLRVISGLVFPYGLVMISLTGADLCTGGFMFTSSAVLHGRLSVHRMFLHWFLSFFGNLAGSLFIVSIICGYSGVFDDEPFKQTAINSAIEKQLDPHWHQIFLRGIGCNWLVCLALFFGVQGKDLASKVIGIWFPIFSFVALGLDHVVANMFFIPTGIWHHAPGISIGLYIYKGIIPAYLGNLIGGILFCGGYYWWQYLAFEPPLAVDGVQFQGMKPTAYHNLPSGVGSLRLRRNKERYDDSQSDQLPGAGSSV